MKIADPNMKFRVETNAGCLEHIATHELHEQGLEDNDLFFVELQDYIDEFGEPDPRDIVEDYLPGGTKKVPGVNVREGKKGWWKRINRRLTGVKRSAELVDENVDPSGEALDRIQNAAKRAVLRDPRAVHTSDIKGLSSVRAACLYFTFVWAVVKPKCNRIEDIEIWCSSYMFYCKVFYISNLCSIIVFEVLYSLQFDEQ